MFTCSIFDVCHTFPKNREKTNYNVKTSEPHFRSCFGQHPAVANTVLYPNPPSQKLYHGHRWIHCYQKKESCHQQKNHAVVRLSVSTPTPTFTIPLISLFVFSHLSLISVISITHIHSFLITTSSPIPPNDDADADADDDDQAWCLRWRNGTRRGRPSSPCSS